MRFMFCKKLLKYAIAGGMFMSSTVYAHCAPWPLCTTGGSIIDPTAIMDYIKMTAQQAADFEKEMQNYITTEQRKLLMNNTDIQAGNNDSANKTLRVTQTMTETRKLDVAKDLAPPPGGCETEDASIRMGEAKCASENYVGTTAARLTAAATSPSASVASQNRELVDIMSQKYATDELPVHPEILWGTAGDVFDQRTKDASEMMTKLVVQPTSKPKDPREEALKGTDTYNAKHIASYENRASLSAPEASLTAIASERIDNGTGDSPMKMMHSELGVIDDSVIKLSGNNNGAGAAWKVRATIHGFKAAMAVKKYEESLRQEGLLAIQLANMMKNNGG